MSKTLILTGVIIVISYLAEMVGFGQYIHYQKWIILSFFVAISFLFHRLMEQGEKNNRENFVQFYLVTVTLRLLLCMIFVGIDIYLGVRDKQLFIITFFALYLCYTVFEISNLSRKLRAN